MGVAVTREVVAVTWAALFARTECDEVTVADVRAALADVREAE